MRHVNTSEIPGPSKSSSQGLYLKISEFIFEQVLSYKHLTLKNDIPFPKIYFKSLTPLKVFQDAIEKQWGQRPKEFSNAYAQESNALFILDDADYYKKLSRCIDDSIAHEMTHFIQVKYLNLDLNDESLEWEAVDIQNWFRENFCKISN